MSHIQNLSLLVCVFVVVSAGVEEEYEEMSGTGDVEARESVSSENGAQLEGCSLNGKLYKDGETFVSNGNFIKRCKVVDLGFRTEIVACVLVKLKKKLSVGKSAFHEGFKYSCKKSDDGVVTLEANYVGSGRGPRRDDYE